MAEIDMEKALEALPLFEDIESQIVYETLCDSSLTPPTGEHWEGFAARHIVQRLRARRVQDVDRYRKALIEVQRVLMEGSHVLTPEITAALDIARAALTEGKEGE